MTNRKSLASILIFVGSLLCFFLPFVTVSCENVKVMTLTGQQMATGTTLQTPQMFGSPKTQKVDANPFAAVALLCAVAGIGLSLLGRKLAAAPAAAGVLGAGCLFMLRATMDSEVQRQGMGVVVQVSYEYGYLLAILLTAAGVGWNIFLITQSKKGMVAVLPPPPNAR